ncbi:MAG: hypothetical protein EON57_17780 [Alphaproteobacteria bacterium]|nr:MAG: hypothetical protein EON57_17780 [Alphaproteobacteria bacterium]
MSADLNSLPVELRVGIDRFIDEQDIPPNPRLSREDALVVIVRDWLQAQGYVALPDGDSVVPVSVASETPSDG